MRILWLAALVLAGVLLSGPSWAQVPVPDAQRPTVSIRCRAGVPFGWRVHGSGAAFELSQSNQERLPAFDTNGKTISYDLEVVAPVGLWHRYRFYREGLVPIEYLRAGYEFDPPVVLDGWRIGFFVTVPILALVGVLGIQALRGRSLRRQLAETHERLSEAEARSGLFPVDGSTPSRIHRYDVVSRLGMGGMAVVYKVRRDSDEYALKLPLPNLLENQDFRARFVREMKLGMNLQHSNLIHIYDVNDGEGEYGYPYIVMELISGLPLKERMQVDPLDVIGVARLGAQVLDALAYIHGRGIIHRDIKPSNIMITASGNAKIMDFGIAYREETIGGRLTSTGDLLGTPLYLAPEQIGGDHQSTDPRVDIYGVGMVLYEALTGRLPWSSTDSVQAVLEKVMHDPPSITDFRRDVPSGLAECIMCMIARNPEARFSSAHEARDAVVQAVGGLGRW